MGARFQKAKGKPKSQDKKNKGNRGSKKKKEAEDIPLAPGDIRPDTGKGSKKKKKQKLGSELQASPQITEGNPKVNKGKTGKRLKEDVPLQKDKRTAEKPSDTDLPANKKRRLKKERQQAKPHYELVVELNKLWNKLREHNITENEKRDLMKELMGLIKGRMHSIAMKHDSSRSVQAALQFGNKYQRKAVLDELCNHVAELSQSTYSHFIVLKMFKYCIKESDSKAALCKAFKGKVAKLSTHAIGSKVLEVALQTFPSRLAGALRLELYGPEYALFSGGADEQPKHLGQLVRQWPERKEKTLQHVAVMINRMHSKGIFVQSFTHSFVWEYLQEATEEAIQELIPNLLDATMQFMSTRYGSKVIALCIGHAAPKHKKKIMKAMKGYVNSILMHRDAYLVMMQIFHCVDDTVNVQKMIMNEMFNPPEETELLEGSELKSNKKILGLDGEEVKEEDKGDTKPVLLQACLGKNSSKALLVLLAPPSMSPNYYGPDEAALLAAGAARGKKDPATRRRELLAALRAPLLAACCGGAAGAGGGGGKEEEEEEEEEEGGAAATVGALLRSLPGAQVLLEMMKEWKDPELQEIIFNCTFSEDAGNDDQMTDNDKAPLMIYEDPAGHLFLKRLIIWEASQASTQETSGFSEAFVQRLEERPEFVKRMIQTNRGSFVFEALLKAERISSKVKSLQANCDGDDGSGCSNSDFRREGFLKLLKPHSSLLKDPEAEGGFKSKVAKALHDLLH